ncbi:hypothetical protein DR88_4923 [Klebsiella pneumoniae]|nr:hypothetical protein DR88_4923 [Klebsiella pneumoniae]
MLSDKSVARFSGVLHSVATLESQFQPAYLCGFFFSCRNVVLRSREKTEPAYSCSQGGHPDTSAERKGVKDIIPDVCRSSVIRNTLVPGKIKVIFRDSLCLRD